MLTRPWISIASMTSCAGHTSHSFQKVISLVCLWLWFKAFILQVKSLVFYSCYYSLQVKLINLEAWVDFTCFQEWFRVTDIHRTRTSAVMIEFSNFNRKCAGDMVWAREQNWRKFHAKEPLLNVTILWILSVSVSTAVFTGSLEMMFVWIASLQCFIILSKQYPRFHSANAFNFPFWRHL